MIVEIVPHLSRIEEGRPRKLRGNGWSWRGVADVTPTPSPCVRRGKRAWAGLARPRDGPGERAKRGAAGAGRGVSVPIFLSCIVLACLRSIYNVINTMHAKDNSHVLRLYTRGAVHLYIYDVIGSNREHTSGAAGCTLGRRASWPNRAGSARRSSAAC